MLELMLKEFGLVVNTVNAGKCGSVRNWYEPPGGSWVPARRRIRGENVLVMLLENALWRVTGRGISGGFGLKVSKYLFMN